MRRRVGFVSSATTDDIARGTPEATTPHPTPRCQLHSPKPRPERERRVQASAVSLLRNEFGELLNGKALAAIPLLVMSRKGEASVPSWVLATIKPVGSNRTPTFRAGSAEVRIGDARPLVEVGDRTALKLLASWPDRFINTPRQHWPRSRTLQVQLLRLVGCHLHRTSMQLHRFSARRRAHRFPD